MFKKKKKEHKYYRKPKTKKTGSKILSLLVIFTGILVLIYTLSFLQRLSQTKAEVVYQPSIVRIEILNGSGVKGAGESVKNFLVKNKFKNIIFDVVFVGDFLDSLVGQNMLLDRSGDEKTVKKISKTLKIDKKNVVYKPLKDNYLDVKATLVLGPDFKKILMK
jgi:hypothetical protein